MSPPDWRLQVYDTLPSTSDLCIQEAESGAPEGLAVLARSQTKARGSRGRAWSEAGGTFAFSVLLRPSGPNALWPFIAGLAFHAALSLDAAHDEALALKWPNDVMLHGRKLGGILIEAGHAGTGWMVIGFGANLAEAPDLAERKAACMAELGPAPDAGLIADRLLEALATWHTRRQEPAAIRQAWLARAHPPGTKLAVGAPDGQITGSFSSIAEDGALLLAVAGGIRRISTGEVLLLQGV